MEFYPLGKVRANCASKLKDLVPIFSGNTSEVGESHVKGDIIGVYQSSVMPLESFGSCDLS